MSNDGGPAYPIAHIPGLHGDYPGMSLRERFAVAIAGNPYALERAFSAVKGAVADLNVKLDDLGQLALLSAVITDFAQAFTDKAMERREGDASELQKLRTENAKMKAKIAEFIDGEGHSEPDPPEDDR
jgi:hypothetical protein